MAAWQEERSAVFERRVEALKRKPYGELTQEEKQALLSLTQEIRTLSGRTGNLPLGSSFSG